MHPGTFPTSADGTARLWDPTTGQHRNTLTPMISRMVSAPMSTWINRHRPATVFGAYS